MVDVDVEAVVRQEGVTPLLSVGGVLVVAFIRRASAAMRLLVRSSGAAMVERVCD